MSNKEKIKTFHDVTCERLFRKYNVAMKKKVVKTSDDELVTKGFLREELDRRFLETMGIIMEQFETINRKLDVLSEEGSKNRHSNLALEKNTDDLEKRIKRLEIAR